jgi:hypothetical protein
MASYGSKNHQPDEVNAANGLYEPTVEDLADRAQQWPEDWPDELYYQTWSTTVDQSAPDPEPADLGDPSGCWFDDDPPKAA